MRRFIFFVGVFVFVASAEAAAGPPCEGTFEKNRFEEDASCYGTKEPEGTIDRLKFVPIGMNESWIGFGGEVRQRYEFTGDPDFGAGRQDKAGVWLQRYVLHGDLHLGKNFRFFGQLFSASESGRAGGGSPVDENRLDWQNAFLELAVPDTALSIRAGRQEIQLGSGRLLDVREGANVRRSFDGIRVLAAKGRWRMDVLALQPRLARRGVFDDRTDKEQTLWGIYGSGSAGFLPGEFDLYYLGFDSEAASYVQGTKREKRHSLGIRTFGEQANWDWNWEAIYQFGSFGAASISAWTIASEAGYRFSAIPWRPRLALSTNIASGDKNPADSELGTFNPLFPRGNYFSEAAVLGPRNFYNLYGEMSVSPAANWSLTAAANFFWRLEKEDGVYSPGGSLIRGPGGSDRRFVASAFSFSSEYALTDRTDAAAIYTRLFSGPFIRDTGPGSDIDFIELTLRFRF